MIIQNLFNRMEVNNNNQKLQKSSIINIAVIIVSICKIRTNHVYASYPDQKEKKLLVNKDVKHVNVEAVLLKMN
jgi:hypothetical protein